MSSFKESNRNNSLLSDTSISSDNLNFVDADENFGSPNAPNLTNRSMSTDKITEKAMRKYDKAIELRNENSARLVSELSAANAEKFRLNCLNQALQEQIREKDRLIDKQEKIELNLEQQKNETLNGQLLELQERYRVEVMKLLSTHCDSDQGWRQKFFSGGAQVGKI